MTDVEKKTRIPIPKDVAAKVMFENDRTCCVCNVPGKSVQIHHIDENPANNEPENLALLCLEDHDDTQLRGGFGRKLNANLVKTYRESWIGRIQERARRADEIVIAEIAKFTPGRLERSATYETDDEMLNHIWHIPNIVTAAFRKSNSLWDSGVTAEMRQGFHDVIDVYRQIWIRLASWYPERHFDGQIPGEYLSGHLAARFSLYYCLEETEGEGAGGTIVGINVDSCVMRDLGQMIVDTVESLVGYNYEFPLKDWHQRFSAAKQ